MRLKDVMNDYGYETWVDERPEYYKTKFVKKPKDFYTTKPWLALRKEVLDFYGKQCMRCKTVKRIIQVDHIKPRSLYPELSLEFSNMQVLCIDCNHDKGQVTEDYRSRLDQLKANLK